MPTLNDAFVNALLADASYVSLIGNNNKPLTSASDIYPAFAKRLTPTLATYLTSNFAVLDQTLAPDGGFDAIVWRGLAGTPFAGKVYVSTRGTQEGQDFLDDGDLAARGVPYTQIANMVNWWLQQTTPANQYAKQIGVLSVPSATGITAFKQFIAAPDAAGTGKLSGVTSIESVNGHSLGGYMASGFTCVFGGPSNCHYGHQRRKRPTYHHAKNRSGSTSTRIDKWKPASTNVLGGMPCLA